MLESLETTTWFQQGAAILTIIGIPIVIFRLVIYKARHKISFQPEETYHEVRLDDYPGRPQSYWLHVVVENTGYELSRNVEGYLSEIWIKQGGTYRRLEEFKAPVKLKWSHEADIHPIDILPKARRKLDVCYIVKNVNILYLMAKGFPSGTVKNMLDPGDYVFIIKIVSENSLIPKTFLLSVAWDGAWKTLKGSQYSLKLWTFRPDLT